MAYSEARKAVIIERFCERIANGESMRAICQDQEMPGRMTIFEWMDEDESFRAKYERAREVQAEYMDDLILETANACTNESAQADRVRIGAYQWRAAKLRPKRYGDKITNEHTGADGAPLTVQVVKFGDK